MSLQEKIFHSPVTKPAEAEFVDHFAIANKEVRANELPVDTQDGDQPGFDNPDIEIPHEPLMNSQEIASPVKRSMSSKEIAQRINSIEARLFGEKNPESKPLGTTQMGATAIRLKQISTNPQRVKVRVSSVPVNKDVIDIPKDVIDEVAATMKRVDFVKQQEDRFGANDKIKPEDVPEGELTYEQYLAQRPAAMEDDTYHENGRIHNAVSGKFASKNKYLDQLENSSVSDHYKKLEDQANRNYVHEEGLQKNESKNESYDRSLRLNAEGEILVQKDARLRGLLSVGEELLTLYNSKLTGEEFEKSVKPKLEEKKAMYDDLYELYAGKGLDERALGYIKYKTNVHVDESDFIPVKGSAYANGEKVAITEFSESADGKKVYVIEKADGSTQSVDSEGVSFKREFEAYQVPDAAPEPDAELAPTATPDITPVAALDPSPDLAPVLGLDPDLSLAPYSEAKTEEKLSSFERAKKWFSKNRQTIQQVTGINLFKKIWDGPSPWLNKHVTKEMSAEAIEKQKNHNRRNYHLGVTSMVVAGALLGGFGISSNQENNAAVADSTSTTQLGSGETAWHIPENNDGGGSGNIILPLSGEGTGAIDVNNPAFEIPHGGTGLGLFHDLNLSDANWKQHSQELLDLYPDTFYPKNGDVRIANEGLLPLDVRKTIASFKNS